MNDARLINVEFYTPYEVKLDDICVITLFKKVRTEDFYEHRDTIESFKKDEDLFISWLASIASSKNYPLARAILIDNGLGIEAIYSSIKPRYFIEHPYLSRVKRIYVVDKLRTPTETTEPVSNPTTEDAAKVMATNLSIDFSNDELYLFFSPITVVNSTKAEALVIETDRCIELLKLGSIPSVESAKVSTKGSKKRKSRKKRRKRKSKRSRKTSKALS